MLCFCSPVALLNPKMANTTWEEITDAMWQCTTDNPTPGEIYSKLPVLPSTITSEARLFQHSHRITIADTYRATFYKMLCKTECYTSLVRPLQPCSAIGVYRPFPHLDES